jgi:hypothetical protein
VQSAQVVFALNSSFSIDQDRLWLAPFAATVPLDRPCNNSLRISPLVPELNGVFGFLLSGVASDVDYTACLRRATYQNLAAFPSPPSLFPDSGLGNTTAPGALVTGVRTVQITVESLPLASGATLRASTNTTLLVLPPSLAVGSNCAVATAAEAEAAESEPASRRLRSSA